MILLRRLPVIAAGLGFGSALVFVADAYDWSGVRFLLAALVVTVIYVLTILAPWLVYEQLRGAAPQGTSANGHWRSMRVTYYINAGGDIFAEDDEAPLGWPETLSDVFPIPADDPARPFASR